jgi:PAS domain S-box-containing protein
MSAEIETPPSGEPRAADGGGQSVAEHYRRQLEAVCNNATVALFIMDGRQHCAYMNPAAERLTGYRLEEVRGRPLHDYVHHTRPDGTPYPLEECPIDRALPENNQEQGEEVFVHKDGRFYPVAFTASPIREGGAPVGTIIEVRDTTREKRAAAERERLLLREREAREEIETLNDLGRALSAELDLRKLVQGVTDAATEMTGAQFGAFFYNVLDEEGASFMLYTLSGAPRAAFEGFPMPRATHLFGPTFEGQGVVRLANVRRDPRYGQNPPHYGIPEGHLPVTSYLAVPVRSRAGEVIGGLFFGHSDEGVFTERHERLVVGLAAQAAVAIDNARLFEAARREREAARAAQTRAQTILESITDAFFALDREWKFTYVNAQAERVLRRGRDTLVGRALWDEFPEAVGSVFERQYRKALDEQVSVQFVEFYPPLEAWFEVSAYPSAEGLAVYFRDVTRRLRAEEELGRSREELIRAQGEMLAELSTPLIPLGRQIVLVPLVGAVNAERAEHLLRNLSRGVREHCARVAIIDITGVPEVDAGVAQALVGAARSVRLLGTEVVITGVRAGVARTLVALGAELSGLTIRRDLQSGMAEAARWAGRS